MFSKYYQSELTYLRELGREYALANPAVAGMLAERGGDPDVERLLEGFAFLTARIRERIDDELPEVIHTLTQLVLPHYLRSIPACTIVEFTPVAGALRTRHKLPRGTEVAATAMEGTSCRFRTTADTDLLPLTLLDVVLDQSVANSPVLRVQFQTTEQGRGFVFQKEGIRLFIHGELSVGSMLLLWLMRYCKAVSIKGQSGKGRPVRIDPKNIVATGFQPNTGLSPWPEFSPEGYQYVQEYFTQPAKFLFFDLVDLAAATAVAEDKFEIAFQFERPPALPARIGRDNLRLHCVPAVNLFSVGADPIRREITTNEYLLRATEVDPKHMEIFSVESVTGLQAGRTERKLYKSFFDYSHAGADEDGSYFNVRRKRSVVDDGIDTYLALHTARNRAPTFAEETLSIDLTCTNRSLPSQLRVGDVSMPTPNSPTIARFKNISPVTTPTRPPFGSELYWRFVAHLALNQRSLTDPGVLRSLLEVYNFQTASDRQAARSNRLRAESIRLVTTKAVERLMGHAPTRGVRSIIELEEDKFASEGEAFLFGSILEHLFAVHVSMNSFSELSIKLHPSQAEYSWRPRNGRQAIL